MAAQFPPLGRSRIRTRPSHGARVPMLRKQRCAASYGARNPNLHRTPEEVSPVHFASPPRKQIPAAHRATQTAGGSPRVSFSSSDTAQLYTPATRTGPSPFLLPWLCLLSMNLKINVELDDSRNWLTVLLRGITFPGLHGFDCRFVQAARKAADDALVL